MPPATDPPRLDSPVTSPEPDYADYLDRVLVGGPEKRSVVIADYDPAWPGRFAAERARIREALGAAAGIVEHIGSTAVPGLAAKPVVDVVVTVADPDDEAAYLPTLEEAGYELRVREPGHRALRTPDGCVNVHITAAGSAELRAWRLLRDWLRHSATDRRAYEDLKRRLAEREWDDINYYAEAKSALISDMLERAQAWERRDTP